MHVGDNYAQVGSQVERVEGGVVLHNLMKQQNQKLPLRNSPINPPLHRPRSYRVSNIVRNNIVNVRRAVVKVSPLTGCGRSSPQIILPNQTGHGSVPLTMTERISKGRDVETKLGKLSLRPNDLLLQLLPRHACQIGMSVSVITNLPSIDILQLPKLGKCHETSTLRKTRNIIESRSLYTVRA